MSCTICGKSVEYPGSTQHFKKHRREFADATGYSEHCDREIIKAWANPENARNWAVEIVEQLKDAGRMPKDANLEDFEKKDAKGDAESE